MGPEQDDLLLLPKQDELLLLPEQDDLLLHPEQDELVERAADVAYIVGKLAPWWPYILKATQSADWLFQSPKFCGKSA